MSIRTGAAALSMAAAVAAGTFAAGPQLAASEIEKGDLKIKFGLRMQGRVEAAFGVTDSAGGKPDIAQNELAVGYAPADDRQDVDFYFRRIRFNMGGSWKNDTFFYLNLNMDNFGRHTSNAAGTTFGTSNTAPVVHDAWVGHNIKSDGLTHTIRFGRQQQWFNMASVDGSGRTLFPNGRPGMGHKNIGLSYKLTAPLFSVGLDIQNAANETVTVGGVTSTIADSREWVISARVESSLTEDMKMRRTESALGKEGFGHVAGIDVAHRTNSVDGRIGWTQVGVDYNVHFNAITANLDFVLRRNDVDGGDNTTEFMITAQAGYAIPMDNGLVVEPALRFIYRDQDQDGDITLGSFETVNQGIQIDAGVNLYINGHNNKFQLAVSHWTADNGDAKKTVARLQHQFQF